MEVAEPLTRRDRERLARRQAMLNAALTVFAEKGYENATVDEIAERAEFGKGTIYNYFPDGKDGLYLTIFQESVAGTMREVIETSFSDLDALGTPEGARRAFRDFIEAFIERFHADGDAILMFMKEGHRTVFEQDKAAVFVEHFVGVIEALVRPIEAAIAAGALRPVPAHPVAHVLMGNIRGYLMAEIDRACDPSGTLPPSPFGSPSEAADFLATVLFDGLLAPDAQP